MKSKLIYEGPERLRANQLFTATLHILLGENVMVGGRIVIATRHVSDFGDAQMADPTAENYISVSSSRANLSWELGPNHGGERHPWNRGTELKLVSGELITGDTVSLILGNPAVGCPGYRCQSFVEHFFRFRLGIDPDGDNNWKVLPVEECPGFEVVGNSMTRIRAYVADVTADTDRRVVYIKPEDAYGNVAGDGHGDVALLLDDAKTIGHVHLEPGCTAKAQVIIPRDGQWHVITTATNNGSHFVRSNPLGSSPVEGHHLYWGEIHAQSCLCDGTNHPSDLYAYAREAAGLDFASVTSHDFELTPRDWKEIQVATRDAHRPGEFVAFLGYEWSGRSDQGGDNNIYFLDDEAPLVYSAPCGVLPAWDAAEGAVTGSRSLTEVIQELQGHQFMVVPHCGGRLCNFDYYDPRHMPLFEMHSCHRNYEHIAHQSIQRRLHFGFIGGSDDHRGAIGDSYPAARERFFSTYNGLVAVYAKELTRKSLWEAFFARRVYATNGKRIVLDVRLNGVLMGSELKVNPGTELHLTVQTRLDGWLDRVEIVRGTETVQRIVGDKNRIDEFRCEFHDVAREGVTAYYVRVTQIDGGVAWSSPIWVDGCVE